MNAAPVVVIPADDPPLVGRSRHLEQLREFAEVRLHTDRPATEAEMLERLRPADIILNSRSAVRITAALLDQLPGLKMIAVCGIGYDTIDLTSAKQHGVTVSNIPGLTATVVAEQAFGMMLAVSRRMAEMTRRVKSGEWSRDLGISLVGRTAGIIGTGNIGSEMIRFCKAFGMNVVAWSFHPNEDKARKLDFRYVALNQLLAESDVVSTHVRLSAETKNLIGATELQLMKQNAIIVNTARAAVIDTSALAEQIANGHLFGAGIDVYDQEPIVPDNPLLSCDNVVLTPHSADQTQEGLDILTQGCVENIRAFLNGNPQNVVSA